MSQLYAVGDKFRVKSTIPTGMSTKTPIARIAVVAVVLAAVTVFYRRLFPVNPTTVALTFLVLVLFASAWGFRIALITAFAATALFNFFFLPPVGTFTIADPQNWIALFSFLITAVVASNLAERARRQTELARERRLEVERLYALSQQLLTSDNTAHLFNRLPNQLTQTFGAQGAALVVSGRDTVYRSDPDLNFDTELLLRANARGEISETESASYVPLRIGVRPAGALAIVGQKLSRETLEAIGSLIGIAAERTRALEELGDTRAAQESEKLRSALLDSVTHEFRTPLTSIKASVTALQEENTLDAAQQRDLLSVINEETDRLNRLVGEAAEMAQLDAHMVRLQRTVRKPKDVIEAALDRPRGRDRTGGASPRGHGRRGPRNPPDAGRTRGSEVPRDDPEAAVDVLAPLLDDSTPVMASVVLEARGPRQSGAWEIEALVLEAIARDALGDPGAASRALERALDVAEPGGLLLLPFLLYPTVELLERQARLRTTHASLIAEILNLLSGHTPAARPEDAAPLQEPPCPRASCACCATCRPTSRRRRSRPSCSCR